MTETEKNRVAAPGRPRSNRPLVRRAGGGDRRLDRRQPDPKPSRSEAIRRPIEMGPSTA